MTTGAKNIKNLKRHQLSVISVVLLFTIGASLGTAEVSPAARILQLTPEKDHYFLGPYLDYLEDPEKKLTIDDVSSPQLAAPYIKHRHKLLNLGLNTNAYWIRFTVNPSEVQNLDSTWLLYFGWPNTIDYATLYIPESPNAGWSTKEVGRLLPTGPARLPSTPVTFLSSQGRGQPLTFYLRIESSDTKQMPLQILTDEAYQDLSRWRSLWFGIYYGIMLAMFLYNLILLFSLRELNRLYYLIYLLFIILLFLAANGLLLEFFNVGIPLGRILVIIFICLVFFWGNLFAKSFLITKKHAPFFDRLLSLAMVLSLVLAVTLPFASLTVMTLAIAILSIVVPPVFLVTAFICWRRGFRPARFFLIAFATLALSTMFEALVTFNILPYLTEYSAQFGSAIEVILLQLALADRFRILSREHDEFRHSLSLAREVQQNLLPHQNPQIDGLDIAGKSIYCDETGGDYFDFIIADTGEDGPIGIAIGDVSGHGISSALLMATVRSSLRQRSFMPGGPDRVLSDVNRRLARDVEDSGQFMTMFYMKIDPAKRDIRWVRAGHDPAIFYDPEKDAFEELGGPGVALGVVEDWEFEENTKESLQTGQIIFLSTDGIWEARNQQGEMFGKETIYDILRSNSALGANEILVAILETLDRFQEGAKIEDDITLVVIKIIG
ncbi:Serine phosphatase RsbU, regulator of sigma subunit [Olavius sp. associated proteobacterium Delta 1]|nr:Serine phosphatase RsbU, regulator of sigma subunit [Olavius sp. associated proteobacterium Delta 1]